VAGSGLHHAAWCARRSQFGEGLRQVGVFGKFAAHYSAQSHNGSNYVELAIVDERGRLRY